MLVSVRAVLSCSESRLSYPNPKWDTLCCLYTSLQQLKCVCVALLAACITASLCNGVWSFRHSSLQQLFWVRVSSFVLWGSVSCMLLFFCTTCIICYKIHIKISVVKRLIASKIKVFVYIICVCVCRMVYRNIWMHVCELYIYTVYIYAVHIHVLYYVNKYLYFGCD